MECSLGEIIKQNVPRTKSFVCEKQLYMFCPILEGTHQS